MVTQKKLNNGVQHRLYVHITSNYGSINAFSSKFQLNVSNVHKLIHGNPTIKSLRNLAKIAEFEEEI